MNRACQCTATPACCDGGGGNARGAAMSSVQRTPKAVQVAAAVVGNALEWYDFIVFGFFAVVIAKLFFPASSQYASLLLTTATFGVGFFMRPVGGVVLGVYADRKGRKAALLLVVGLMTIAIALIGLALTRALTPDQLDGWGWRVPFLFGLIIGPLGLYIRRHLEETTAFIQAAQKQHARPALGDRKSTR